MIKKPQGYDEAKVYKEVEKLPAGGYVVEIKNAKVEQYTWGDVLILMVDIAEGEHKDFYKKNYDEQDQEDKKWKGTIRLNLPKGDGTKEDGWTTSRFKTNMVAVEESNNGYRWDWDETSLKGKKVGALFRNKEYEFNGKRGFFTEGFMLWNAEKIRNGEFKMPKDKLLNNNSQQNDMSIPEGMQVNDDDIPF